MNSLFQQLNPQKSANPVMRMLQNNPNYDRVMKEVQANGGDAKSLFYKKAKELGIDPNYILSMLK